MHALRTIRYYATDDLHAFSLNLAGLKDRVKINSVPNLIVLRLNDDSSKTWFNFLISSLAFLVLSSFLHCSIP